MNQKRHKLTYKIADKCLSLDLYGREVNFTFRGHEKFRTKFGAICTIMIGIMVILYGVFSLNDLLRPNFSEPVHSKMLYTSFYEVNEELAATVMERDGSTTRIEAF